MLFFRCFGLICELRGSVLSTADQMEGKTQKPSMCLFRASVSIYREADRSINNGSSVLSQYSLGRLSIWASLVLASRVLGLWKYIITSNCDFLK